MSSLGKGGAVAFMVGPPNKVLAIAAANRHRRKTDANTKWNGETL